jgi:hypothetical protein
MNTHRLVSIFLFLSCLIASNNNVWAQITSTAEAVVPTEYSSGEQDKIHVFCGEKGFLNASLIASYPQGETGNFEWQKYNTTTGSFDLFSTDQSGNQTSSISGLADGCYRVKITPASGAKTYTAWVFNNYIVAKAEITDSNCSSFTLKGTFDSPEFTYVDLNTKQAISLKKDVKVSWKDGQTSVGNYATLVKSDPPTKNTTYTFLVTDKFGCTDQTNVEYVSIVTKASFTYKIMKQGPKQDMLSSTNPSRNEAPLTVEFTNTSENGGSYEWYFYKSFKTIDEEKRAGIFKDSIQEVLYNENPTYVFEASGEYQVKLISKRNTDPLTCTSYQYIDDYIKVDTSFIDAPNLYMPYKLNPEFAIRFFSMKSIKFTILNRWGKVLHTWEGNNLQGFSNTVTSITQSVWDGKVGGRMATPGVYFWVAEGIGRDGVRRKENGFFHLFRDK